MFYRDSGRLALMFSLPRVASVCYEKDILYVQAQILIFQKLPSVDFQLFYVGYGDI